jgi:hypothetical protein
MQAFLADYMNPGDRPRAEPRSYDGDVQNPVAIAAGGQIMAVQMGSDGADLPEPEARATAPARTPIRLDTHVHGQGVGAVTQRYAPTRLPPGETRDYLCPLIQGSDDRFVPISMVLRPAGRRAIDKRSEFLTADFPFNLEEFQTESTDPLTLEKCQAGEFARMAQNRALAASQALDADDKVMVKSYLMDQFFEAGNFAGQKAAEILPNADQPNSLASRRLASERNRASDTRELAFADGRRQRVRDDFFRRAAGGTTTTATGTAPPAQTAVAPPPTPPVDPVRHTNDPPATDFTGLLQQLVGAVPAPRRGARRWGAGSRSQETTQNTRGGGGGYRRGARRGGRGRGRGGAGATQGDAPNPNPI